MRTLSNDERMNLSNAKALRRAREHLRITREDLARRLGLSPKSIEKYENGRANLDENKIVGVLLALGIRSGRLRF
jgi:transcriptional regulator with XRE-family HTH domain